MLDVARAASTEMRPAIEWRQGDATDLPFDNEVFDIVFCQQVLQFIADPGAALLEMRRVLRPDGRLVMGVLRSLEFNSAYDVLADALEEYVGHEAAEMMRSPFPAWDIIDLRALIQDAGFEEVTITFDIRSLRYPSAEEFLRREAASSPLAGPVGSLSSSVRNSLLNDLEELLKPYTDDRGIILPMETQVAVSHR
jgi:SAM-dependent methyltransferase